MLNRSCTGLPDRKALCVVERAAIVKTSGLDRAFWLRGGLCRPDLAVGVYLLQAHRQSPEHDRSIPDDIRREVLRRDGYKCKDCAWSHDEWNPSDPRHLELHHIKHHVKGGENVQGNLKTLCTVCHDKVHRREKKRV